MYSNDVLLHTVGGVRVILLPQVLECSELLAVYQIIYRKMSRSCVYQNIFSFSFSGVCEKWDRLAKFVFLLLWEL